MIRASIDSPGVIDKLSYRRFNNIYYFGYPCSLKTTCSPFKVVFRFKTIAKVELWGASGGPANSQNSSLGGKGGYVSGKHLFRQNIPYYFYIGAMGEKSGRETFGGGASGTTRKGDGGCYGGGSGGGATDIRMIKGDSEEALKSRIIVAAGGAGSEYYGTPVPGGYGGGLYGQNSTRQVWAGSASYVNGSGATPFIGGIGRNGIFGQLGKASPTVGTYGSGGGGGYYGGGSGGSEHAIVYSGAGGSSFVSGIDIWNKTFYNGEYYRFFVGKTIAGNENVPVRFDIKNNASELDGLLKLTVLAHLHTSVNNINNLLCFLIMFVFSK